MRQHTLFRIVHELVTLQADFLAKRRPECQHPVSLRQLARSLRLSASTVSRAMSGRSVLLPWGEEIPLIGLAPGRRQVVRAVLATFLDKQTACETDAGLAARLEKEYGIRLSRRTVTAVRHELG